MYQVEAKPSAKLLKIRFTGHVDSDQAKECLEKVRSLLTEMKPGFRLLTDLTGLESMGVACAAYLKQTMDLCNDKGIEKVIRVIPDPRKDIGLQIMSLFHYGRGVRITRCEGLAEAEKVLSVLSPP